MANVISFAEKRAAVLHALRGIQDVLKTVAQAKRTETYMRSGTVSSETEIAAAVQDILDDAAAMRDEVVAGLQAINFQHQIVIVPGRDFTSSFIDAVDGTESDKTSVFTSTLKKPPTNPFTGSPFACFAAGDVIEISQAEISGNNKELTVASIEVVAGTSEKIIATEAVTGMADSDADDTTAIYILKKR